MTIKAIAVCPGTTASVTATGTFTVGETHIISARVSSYDPALSTDGVTVTLSGNGIRRTAQVLNGSAAFDGLPDGTYTLSFAATASFAAASARVTVAGSNQQVQVTLQKAGTGSAGFPSATIPISSGAGAVSVTVSVSGGTAVLGALSDSEISTLVSDEKAPIDVVFDLSGLQGVTTVDLPTETFGKLAQALAEHGGDDTVTIRTAAGERKFDEGTILAIAAQTAGETVSLTLEKRPFVDVAVRSWYYDAVYYCYDNGYFYGTDGDHFTPKGTMTRAMFAAVLYRMAGEPPVEGENPFTDVKNGKWYTDAILWALGEKIIVGYGNGKFGTNDPVTREQMVTLFWRYNGKPTGEGADLSAFSDADRISGWARDAFAWAVGAGILSGKGNGILDPKGAATRAEVAQIVMSYETKFGS